VTYDRLTPKLALVCNDLPRSCMHRACPCQRPCQDTPSGDVKDHGGRKVKTSVKPAFIPTLHGRCISQARCGWKQLWPRTAKFVIRASSGEVLCWLKRRPNAVRKWKYEEAAKETVETV